MNISFIGMGKLGLPLACCLAEYGHTVHCVDTNTFAIHDLQYGKAPFYEPELQLLLASVKSRMTFTNLYDDRIAETDATFILVNTQIQDSGYSPVVVNSVLDSICEVLKNRPYDSSGMVNNTQSPTKYHTFILSSTVPPGSIELLIERIEKKTGYEFGIHFGFVYIPDFVKLGSVIRDFKNPDFFMVGYENDRDRTVVEEIFKGFHPPSVPEYYVNLKEAEIAKVALNAYVVQKISFANYLGMLCDGIGGVNVNNITTVIGNDKRIGTKFFRSGTPYGGTCFPRDVQAFINFAKQRDDFLPSVYIGGNMKFSEYVNESLLERLDKKIQSIFDDGQSNFKVGFLGVSFKPNSPVLIESPTVNLVNEYLHNEKIDLINLYDPHMDEMISNFRDVEKIAVYSDPQACINESDVVVIMHPDERYRKCSYGIRDVIDPWGVLL